MSDVKNLFNEALQLFDSFNDLPPTGFSVEHYNELKNLAEEEKALLNECYSSKLNEQDC